MAFVSKLFKSHCKDQELLLVTLLLISAFIQNLEKYFLLLEVTIFKQNHYFIAEWHIDAVNSSKRAKKSLKRINITGICVCSFKIWIQQQIIAC